MLVAPLCLAGRQFASESFASASHWRALEIGGHGFDLLRGDHWLFLRIADQKRKVAKAIDPPRHASGERENGFQRRAVEDVARGAGGLQSMDDI